VGLARVTAAVSNRQAELQIIRHPFLGAHKCRGVCPELPRWATKRKCNGALVAVRCGCQQTSQLTKDR